MSIRIGIVDDHRLFRKSMITLISSFENANIVLEAENGADLLHKLRETPVDLLLLDLEMPVMDGFEVCQVLRNSNPTIKILIVSQLTTKESVYKTLQLGANGYFTKNSDPSDLETAINNVMDKDYHFDVGLEYVIEEALKIKHTGTPYNIVDFSHRETEIIILAAQGKSSVEISDALFLSPRTVDTHKRNIIEKSGCKNFIDVIFFALRHHHITLEMITG